MSLIHRLETWLADPAITDICIHGPQRTFIDRGQGMEAQLPSLDASTESHRLKSWTLDQLSKAGKSWDARSPFIDAPLEPSHRLHVVFPPIAGTELALSIRRLGRSHSASSNERWASNSVAFQTLKQAVERQETILISGSTGSGKTTLLNDLLAFAAPEERLLAIEDTPELFPQHPHFLSLLSRPPNADGFGEVTIRTLLKQSLRMRPDRILVGECRGAEVLEFLQVLNTGHRGSLATIHANSARDALRRLELLCLLSAPESVSISALREWIASGIQWVAYVERSPKAGRRIQEVARLQGIEAGTILLRPVLDAGARTVV
ncbi:MAG: Pertussis toxin liberation protein [Pseudomonadota bacterium]|jgi:pilus assembly protein CpaF